MPIQNTAGLTSRLFAQRAAFPATRMGQRHFSCARPLLKEIQDAYILSAQRTPTTNVCIYGLVVLCKEMRC